MQGIEKVPVDIKSTQVCRNGVALRLADTRRHRRTRNSHPQLLAAHRPCDLLTHPGFGHLVDLLPNIASPAGKGRTTGTSRRSLDLADDLERHEAPSAMRITKTVQIVT